IVWLLKAGYGMLVIDMDERLIKIKIAGGKPVNWFLDLTVADKSKLPFITIGQTRVNCKFQGMNYFLQASKGTFKKSGGDGVFKIYPEKGSLVLNLSGAGN